MANSIGTKGLVPVVIGVLGVGSALAADKDAGTNGPEASQTAAPAGEAQEVSEVVVTGYRM